MATFKISILEKDGVEYGLPVEYDLATALSEVGFTGSSGNTQIDGGTPDSNFNATTAIDGGNV